MTMRIYSSSDASAPVLEGVVGGALTAGAFASGSFLEVLRQILVAGYGSQTAAGWTMPFTATSHASFKQGAGCGFYIDVLDDGSLTAGAREAQCVGYEAMSAVGTGTGLFPTAVQQSTGIKFRKSDAAASTPVIPWLCFADASTFYFFSVPQYPSGTLYYAALAFGNFHSFVPNDAYNCMIIGRVTSATLDGLGNENLDAMEAGAAFIGTKPAGHYLARGYSQSGAALNFPVYNAFGQMSGSALANGNNTSNVPYPNPSDNSLLLAKAFITDPDTAPITSLRGYMRGFYLFGQDGSKVPIGTSFTGTGNLAGRTFRVLGLRTGSGVNGRVIMETSDTWDS
jgi:hypothetical protein